jgi:WD40 repeat protein
MVYMYDVVSKEVLASFAAHTGVVTSLCPVPNSNGLLTAGADGKIHLWEDA